MTAYVTVHAVGVHVVGEVVEIGKEAEKLGVDVKRLVGLGAIREATKEEAKQAQPFGESNPDIVLRPIPQVPATPPAVSAAEETAAAGEASETGETAETA